LTTLNINGIIKVLDKEKKLDSDSELIAEFMKTNMIKKYGKKKKPKYIPLGIINIYMYGETINLV